MKIAFTSLIVNDQSKALKFYTEVLGFEKKHDIPMGGEFRWITVTNKGEPGGTELVFEPSANPVGKAFQDGLFAQGIPATMFQVADLDAEFKRLKDKGVAFKQEPMQAGPVRIAVFNDTVGNWIQLIQP